MGMAVTKDGQRPTVCAVSFLHGRGTVFYASLPRDSEARQNLAATLWNHLVALEHPRRENGQASCRTALPIKVVHGLLGRPRLLLGGERGPAISFSEGGGKVWAALSADNSEIGIDVAASEEFQGNYPFLRVFHPQELEHAVGLAGGDLAKACALLWSVKEAVVKALGCAFHLVDPLQINVHPAAERACWYNFPVVLTGKALTRFPLVADRALWVRSLSQGNLYLSIALFAAETGRP